MNLLLSKLISLETILFKSIHKVIFRICFASSRISHLLFSFCKFHSQNDFIKQIDTSNHKCIEKEIQSQISRILSRQVVLFFFCLKFMNTWIRIKTQKQLYSMVIAIHFVCKCVSISLFINNLIYQDSEYMFSAHLHHIKTKNTNTKMENHIKYLFSRTFDSQLFTFIVHTPFICNKILISQFIEIKINRMDTSKTGEI